MIVGVTGILKIGNAPDLLSPLRGKRIVGIGAIIIIIGILQLWKEKFNRSSLKKSGRYLCIWAGSLLGVLLLFKGPFLIYNLIQTHTFSAGEFTKGIILATTETTTGITNQTIIDNQTLTEITPSACSSMQFSDEELKQGMKNAVEGNEDVGRYVGYGRHTFENKGFSL